MITKKTAVEISISRQPNEDVVISYIEITTRHLVAEVTLTKSQFFAFLRDYRSSGVLMTQDYDTSNGPEWC